jgi:esterase/lipase superfamily enzyme
MSYAAVEVSIPPDSAREIGRIQWPEALPGNPAKNFVTTQAAYLQKLEFIAALAQRTKQVSRGRVLVFVHGFNNRFDDAVYRFAQIVHDSRAPGTPVLFTWPSRGEIKLRSYTYDRESANYSRDAFEDLLDTLSRQPSVTEVNVLAHSMGNWVALEALRSRAIKGGRIGDKVKNVMLVAPDVDVDVFRTQIRRMGKVRPRFVLFVSQDDQALALSKTIWGGVPRLGDINPEQEPYRDELESERIEVFDLTKLKTAGDDAHNRAFEDVTSVVAMVKERMRQGQEMSERSSDLSQWTQGQ